MNSEQEWEKKAGDKRARQSRRRKFRRAIERARREWQGDPNIAGIGIGAKHVGGKVTDKSAITFHVYRKLTSEGAIRAVGSKTIPKEYGGFPTDVKIFDAVAPAQGATGDRDETRYDPLVGGVATSNADEHILWFNGYGTLGTLCYRGSTPMALSNWHVWADGGDVGDDIIQPGHPRAQEHFEALGKVAFCGPLLGSLFEWEAPSPLTWGLYGGAAAAAIAAAASDEIDPTRRGQDATPTNPGERTLLEQVDMEIEYLEQPIPGTPYQVEVEWKYKRTTNERELTHGDSEIKTNPHVLAFKQLWSDRAKYRPGGMVRLFARIASPHPSPCDSYFVVAHCIPDKDPTRLVSTVLSPIPCDEIKPPEPVGERICVEFEREKPGSLYPPDFRRDSVAFSNPTGGQNRIVDFDNDGKGELFLQNRLVVSLPLCRRVEATIFYNHSITMNAYYLGQLVGSVDVSGPSGREETLVVEAASIDRVEFTGGQWECSLLKLCYDPRALPSADVEGGEVTHREQTRLSALKPLRVCCYAGEMAITANEQADTWNGYLLVQNINDVPEGTSPEEAATTIGGMIVSQNCVAQAVGCGALMLADHAFDVI